MKWSSSSTSPRSFVTTPVTDTVNVTASRRVTKVRTPFGSTFHVFETRLNITPRYFIKIKKRVALNATLSLGAAGM